MGSVASQSGTPRTYEVLYNLGTALYNLDRNEEAARSLAEAAVFLAASLGYSPSVASEQPE